MDARQMALDNMILRVVSGSQLYGTQVDDSGDRDELGICVESQEYVLGLGSFEQYELRTAEERAKQEGRPHKGAPSEPGDLDLKIYSLKKFLRLAIGGNPTLVLLFFATGQDALIWRTSLGEELQALAPFIVSTRAAANFGGYMVDQRERMLGHRGQLGVHRPELVEKYGYDTKYGYHVIRLGLQGIELLSTGRITLPMPAKDRELVLSIRTGKMPFPAMIELSDHLQAELARLMATKPLPPRPDERVVNAWLQRAYLLHWEL